MILTYYTGDVPELTPTELALYGKLDPVRQMTRAAIRRYVNQHRELLSGRVLDYGCGKRGTCPIPQPYRSMLPSTEYVGWDLGDPPITEEQDGTFDAILCTQVLQNAPEPAELMCAFYRWLKPGGYLVLTYPVAWEEIEYELWRFTAKGIWGMAHRANFNLVEQAPICSVRLDGSLNLVLVEGSVWRK